ncbi:c-type cytochrome [Chelativorans sp. AA-79]|uniref:c-type cytochrome n=1 Tax=Chelativorans sp. AA-79 TaxID=3028735 RepID=UPI0023F6D0B8|nr:c-type cytochrome [Chelativorans sp. AA-79]WEX10195.1 c-type cytochrome [Chelativorans sp. AA-79]
MRWLKVPSWPAIVIGVVIAVIGGLFLGAVFVLSGVYNVAASQEHFGITNAIIRLTLRRSVDVHSITTDVPDLSDEGLAALGARHFALGCAACHGSPASAQNPVVAEMYPAPPPLSEAVEDWDTEELFWIVKHGLKFTGMPSWPALERDEEVWALVAFLERLPETDAEDYAALAGLENTRSKASLEFGAGSAGQESTLALCTNCHGSAEEPPVHPLVPALEGQKQPYLLRALEEYAARKRPSGIMQAVAEALDPQQMETLARAYSLQAMTRDRSAALDAQAVARGEEIALNGVRADDVPACSSCHRADTSGQFPRLDGLSAEYISTQLSLFRNGIRDGSTYSAIMMPIARRLSDRQIEDLTAYYASRTRQPSVSASRGSGAFP